MSHSFQNYPEASGPYVSKIVSKEPLEVHRYSLYVTHMLTDTKLRALKPRESVFRIADAGGLCVEVRPTGSRLWRFRYRYSGKARMLALGEYPTVSLMEARSKRDEARADEPVALPALLELADLDRARPDVDADEVLSL